MIAWSWRRTAPQPERHEGDRPTVGPAVGDVVVVASEPGLRHTLTRWTERVAARAVAVRSMSAALRRVRRDRPDVVVIDWAVVRHAGQLEEIRSVTGGGATAVFAVLAPEQLDDAGPDVLKLADDLLLLPTSAAEVRARLQLVALRRDAARSGTYPRVDDRDALTGLAARETLIARLRRSCDRAGRLPDRRVALLFLDIDRFQHINESLGHGRGDELLRALAERLVTVCRPTDVIARFGGDEFVILLEDIPDVRAVTVAAERVQQQVRTPFDLDGQEVYVTISIGIAVWSPQHRTAEELIRDADTAKSRAKSLGRDRFVVFDEAMHAEVVEALALENDLRRALVRSEFQAAYQPIVSLGTGRIVGFEALARWRHPERGILRPTVFIAAAEEMGLVIQLDRALAEEACSQLRTWHSRFRRHGDLTIAVNISSTQFLQVDLVPRIDHILRKTGLYGRSLVLEVTESVLMENARHAADMLAQLRALDIRLSIDDFGTGYSSLAYLRRFDVDTLKIDRSFVARVADDEESREIVRTIANLGAALGKHTVAEGVETRAQLEAVRELGVKRVQGNLISPPVGAAAATALLDLVADSDDHMATVFDARLRGDPAAAITGFG